MTRKNIAAANWKMNLTLEEGQSLLKEITEAVHRIPENGLVLFAVPYVYLHPLQQQLPKAGFHLCAQNISAKESGAYTGEISCAMLNSIGISYTLVGHSERREYNHETNAELAEKLNKAIASDITPVFCCGEPLEQREAGTQNDYVSNQLQESLLHLSPEEVVKTIIAYEPIWAIGTGKTAGKEQAEEMHAHIRSVLEKKYGAGIANSISILYGGSVKADNAKELFAEANVDGGLVGGASLKANEFIAIIEALG